MNKSCMKSARSNCSTTNVQPRKASTPTHDKTALSKSPDISCIELNEAKFDKPRRTNFGPCNPKKESAPKKAIKKMSLQDQLSIEYAKTIQSIFKSELEKSTSSKIDSDLTTLQNQITENEEVLRKTNERLQSIRFNEEVDTLYKLHNPRHGQILETLDGTNFEEHMFKLNTQLEQTQNQLQIKNIEPPKGGGAQLMKDISETLSAFEKLKQHQDVETPKILKEVKDINKSIINSLSRAKDNLPVYEDLLLNRATLAISAQEDS